LTRGDVDACVHRLASEVVATARRTSETNLLASGLHREDLACVLDWLDEMDAANHARVVATLRHELPTWLRAANDHS
jgi:hypothetical protein